MRPLQSNYEVTLENNDLTKCPDYWGGFSFMTYSILNFGRDMNQDSIKEKLL